MHVIWKVIYHNLFYQMLKYNSMLSVTQTTHIHPKKWFTTRLAICKQSIESFVWPNHNNPLFAVAWHTSLIHTCCTYDVTGNTIWCRLIFHSEGHLAILYHGHALGSIMGMPVGINAPSCPRGSAHPRDSLHQMGPYEQMENIWEENAWAENACTANSQTQSQC